MVEKWINLKANPKVKKASWNTKNLFIDSDKDGVANIFDCQPYNKRKQDVLMPRSYGNPMREMYNRQAAARQQQIQMKMQKEWALQEAERLRLEQEAQLNQPNVTQAPIITYSSGGSSRGATAQGVTKTTAVSKGSFNISPTPATPNVFKAPAAPKTLKEQIMAAARNKATSGRTLTPATKTTLKEQIMAAARNKAISGRTLTPATKAFGFSKSSGSKK